MDEKEILTDELLFNVIQDIKKKELSMVTRGKILLEVMRRNNYSNNDAVRELGIGKTTIHTWKRAVELGEEKYNELLEHGWSSSDIQNALKNNSALEIKKKALKKRIDIIIEEAISNLNQYVHKKDYSTETPQNIRELQNVLNRILMRAEK